MKSPRGGDVNILAAEGVRRVADADGEKGAEQTDMEIIELQQFLAEKEHIELDQRA